MKIQVTEEHIKKGIPENCESCAVALAVQEQLPNNYNVGVFKGGEDDAVYFGIHNKHNDLVIGNTIHKRDLDNLDTFIETFDRNYEWDFDNKVSVHKEESKYSVEPFEFDVEIEGLNV